MSGYGVDGISVLKRRYSGTAATGLNTFSSFVELAKGFIGRADVWQAFFSAS
jgi:hypothetical protein